MPLQPPIVQVQATQRDARIDERLTHSTAQKALSRQRHRSRAQSPCVLPVRHRAPSSPSPDGLSSACRRAPDHRGAHWQSPIHVEHRGGTLRGRYQDFAAYRWQPVRQSAPRPGSLRRESRRLTRPAPLCPGAVATDHANRHPFYHRQWPTTVQPCQLQSAAREQMPAEPQGEQGETGFGRLDARDGPL